VAVEISFVEAEADDTSATGAVAGVVATGASTLGPVVVVASAGAVAAGTASVDAAAGAVAGVVGAETVCGVVAGTEAAAVTLVVEAVDCAAAVELVSVGGWACEWSSSYIFSSNAARAAAWSGVSSARAEITVAATTTHKPNWILFFINFLSSPALASMSGANLRGR